MSVLLIFDLVGRVSRLSTFIKSVSVTVACVATIGRCILFKFHVYVCVFNCVSIGCSRVYCVSVGFSSVTFLNGYCI